MARHVRLLSAVAAVAWLLWLARGASAAREGDVAPSFELPNTMEEVVSLDDYAGGTTVLVFYRGFF